MKALRSRLLAALFLLGLLHVTKLFAGTPPGAIEFAAGGFSISETGLTAVITVRRIHLDGDPCTVSYSTMDGDARAGEDYDAVSGTVRFVPYQTNATFAVPIKDDNRFEGIKTVRLVLFNPTDGATLGTRSNAVLTILDDESVIPGLLDESFEPGTGVRGAVRAIAVESGGKILIGGDFDQVSGVARNGLARLSANGSLIATFQPGLPTGARVNAVVAVEQGKVLIGGNFTAVGTASRGGVARLREDGSVDPTFESGVGANREVLALCVQADQRVLLGGAFDAVQGVERKYLARLNPDGSLDTRFVAPVPDGLVRCISLQPDGKILVGGSFTTMSGAPCTFVARLKPDGALDDTFAPGGGNTVHNGTGLYSLAVQTDGRILVSGEFSILFGRGQSALMRLHADGALDESFGANVPTGNAIWSIAVQSDGRVLVGGNFLRLANPSCCDLVNRNGIARLNSDGSVDTSFEPGAGASPPNVAAVVLQPDLKVLLGGSFTEVDGRPRSGIARLIGDMAPRIQSMDVTPDREVALTILAQPNQAYVIEVSTDTVTWAPLATNVSTTALLNFVDRASPGADRKFYRVHQLMP